MVSVDITMMSNSSLQSSSMTGSSTEMPVTYCSRVINYELIFIPVFIHAFRKVLKSGFKSAIGLTACQTTQPFYS